MPRPRSCMLGDILALSVSDRMKRVRQRDTKPEVEVRRLLHQAGLRFRLCPKTLPGSPDLANRRAKWAVFVHGCFWHGHRACALATLPKTNTAFWREKLTANRTRDRRKAEQLKALGFEVLVVWQCQLSNPTLRGRLVTTLRDRSR